MADQFEDYVNLTRPSGHNSIGGDVDIPPSEDELLRILECPVCAEFPSPPIYSCAKGHFICNACIVILDACTTCQSPFTQIRNYALEAIVERTKFKCRYKNDGCEESIMGEEYLKHAAECIFRPLKCHQNRNLPCHLISYPQQLYLQHLINVHGMDGQIIAPPSHLFGIFTQRLADHFPSLYLKFEGRPFNQSFLLHTRKFKSYVCWWVTCLSVENKTRKSAVLTWAKVHLDATPESVHHKFTIKWKLPIQHENQSFEEIRDAGTCAVLPLQHLNQLQDQDNPDNEIRWILGLEIQDNPNYMNFQQDGGDCNVVDRYTWLICTIQHYAPLLVLIFIGLVLCIYYGFQDSSGRIEETSHYGGDEYYGGGYRGFYYRDQPNRNEI